MDGFRPSSWLATAMGDSLLENVRIRLLLPLLSDRFLDAKPPINTVAALQLGAPAALLPVPVALVERSIVFPPSLPDVRRPLQLLWLPFLPRFVTVRIPFPLVGPVFVANVGRLFLIHLDSTATAVSSVV